MSPPAPRFNRALGNHRESVDWGIPISADNEPALRAPCPLSSDYSPETHVFLLHIDGSHLFELSLDYTGQFINRDRLRLVRIYAGAIRSEMYNRVYGIDVTLVEDAGIQRMRSRPPATTGTDSRASATVTGGVFCQL